MMYNVSDIRYQILSTTLARLSVRPKAMMVEDAVDAHYS